MCPPPPPHTQTGNGTKDPSATTPTGNPPTCTTCPGTQKKVVCYYPNWAYYRSGEAQYLVPDIDPSLCTHVIYSFAILDTEELGMKPSDISVDTNEGWNNYEKFVMTLRESNPAVKLILALGGWTDSQNNKAAYKEMMGTEVNRAKFIQ